MRCDQEIGDCGDRVDVNELPIKTMVLANFYEFQEGSRFLGNDIYVSNEQCYVFAGMTLVVLSTWVIFTLCVFLNIFWVEIHIA
jgi:hypothetical protein